MCKIYSVNLDEYNYRNNVTYKKSLYKTYKIPIYRITYHIYLWTPNSRLIFITIVNNNVIDCNLKISKTIKNK